MVLRSLGIQLPPGATVYPGTIQRAYSSYPDYTLTYSDAYETFTVYLPANQITGGTLPNPIPNPVAVDYVYNIDEYHYTLSFNYQGVAYSAHYTTSPPNNPYLSGDAHHCNIPFADKYSGTVNICSTTKPVVLGGPTQPTMYWYTSTSRIAILRAELEGYLILAPHTLAWTANGV